MFPIGNTKPFFEDIFRPWARGFAKAGVTANQVTTASIVLSMAAGGIVLTWPEEDWALLTVPGVLMLRFALDHIDGLLAREHGMSSPLGCLLNEHLNAVGDVALYLPLAVVPGVSPYLAVPAVVLAVVIELTGAVAVQIGAERRADGPMAKKPRAVVFGGLALALALGVEPGPWLDGVLAGTVALMVVTVFNRAHKALHEAAT